MDHGTKRPVRRGFSVLELTIAIAILGIMMTVAGIALLPNLGRARVKATETQMKTIGQALVSYKAEKGAFPQTLLLLATEEFIDGTTEPLDAWDRPFYYSPQGPTPNTFILISLGEDGRENTEDDIDYADLRR